MATKQIVLIVGMGRSGTSALTRVLSLCGCALPQRVLGSTEINRKGIWESVDIWKMNLKFLHSHRSGAFDPSMELQQATLDPEEADAYIHQAQQFLSETTPGSALLIKQPTLSYVMELWLEATRRAGYDTKVIIPVRHPSEVHASATKMYAASGMSVSMELMNAVWLKRTLLAERHSRNLPRVFVEYSSLLRDWRHETWRIQRTLGLELRPDEPAIDDFLTPELHRERSERPVQETFCNSWTTRAYAIASTAARDKPVDIEALDEIFEGYCAAEKSFRIALSNFRDIYQHVSAEQFKEDLDRWPVMEAGQDF